MPLSAPAARERLHERRIVCRGYRRRDGLWDIEATLTDAKTYDFPNAFRGTVHAGEPVHDMAIRLTVDDELVVRAVEAALDAGPYRLCPEITPAFAVLEGRRIGPGWTREVKRLLGGTKGCTHLVDLLGPAATTAIQTIVPLRERTRAEAEGRKTPPRQLDSCHALARDGEVVRELWPEFYTGS